MATAPCSLVLVTGNEEVSNPVLPLPLQKPPPPPSGSSFEVADWLQLVEKIGEGSFGIVFRGVNLLTGGEVAVKISKQVTGEANANLLQKEHRVMQSINNPGFPRSVAFFTHSDHQVLVMDLLGPSLWKLLRACNGTFTLKTTLMLADQVLVRLQMIHDEGWIHCDVKPENLVMGTGELKCNQVFMIDFGLTHQYHRPGQSFGLVGTAIYASVHSHKGFRLGPKDDLESWGYTMLKFLTGKLPWDDLEVSGKKAAKVIGKMKCSIPYTEMFHGFPECFSQYMAYIRQLQFGYRPNYSYLRGLFQQEMTKLGFMYDCQFDWILHKHINAVAQGVVPGPAEQ